ncbi:putative F-box domain-containing protein [Helianthus annuus]|uniref:F-box domain-containing protein n=1 Tax=Helianthus annuus TaxID=4232 RepID=A0A9K3ENQ9_HELAN|nr:putative F-box domain-containing protein [Helianthus annuus]
MFNLPLIIINFYTITLYSIFFFIYFFRLLGIMELIGDDMIFEEILSRLPAKAVCRFKCVSKQWCYELSTPKFVFIHTRRVGNSIQKKLLSLKESSIVVDDIVSGNLEVDTSKTVNFPYDVHPSFLSIICSFNGLILVCIKRNPNELVLWNPTTRRFKLISDDYFIRYFGRHYDTGGMYLDEDNDLKVLHINCYWDVIPPGERNIVAYDVISESFSLLRFPEHIEVNPCQVHFLTNSNKLHVIVVHYAGELIADLVKYEHDDWIKVFSFNKAHIVQHLEPQQRTNVIQDNKWLITSICGDTVEVLICNDSFNYIQHVDSYNGPKGALFLETIVSPFD